jgi:hypothetical protein
LRGSWFLRAVFLHRTGLFDGMAACNSLYYKKLTPCEAHFSEISRNSLSHKELRENSDFSLTSLAKDVLFLFPGLFMFFKELPYLLMTFLSVLVSSAFYKFFQ